jgi:hypothetical protein
MPFTSMILPHTLFRRAIRHRFQDCSARIIADFERERQAYSRLAVVALGFVPLSR